MRHAILFIMMLLLCAVGASATITYSDVAPANLAAQTSTSMLFNLTATTDADFNSTGRITTWLFINPNVSTDTMTENTSVVVTNATWRNFTVSSLTVGFYQYYFITNDTDGNTTSNTRWFEIRDSTNQTYFSWRNDTGFEAMVLNRDNGNLNVTGTAGIGGVFTAITTSLFVGDVSMSGDLDVVGNFTGNQLYGEMWNYTANASAWTFALAEDVYQNLTGLGDGSLNGFTTTCNATGTGGCYLTNTFAGTYLVNAHLSFEPVSGGALISVAVVEDFDVTLNRQCYARQKMAVNTVNSVDVHCFMPLDASDSINIQIENEENGNDVNIHTVNLDLVRVGD